MHIDPPPPAGGEYPLTALTPSFIRNFVNQAGYAKTTGKTPPAYNPSMPIKTWDDTRKFATATTIIGYDSAVLDPTGQLPIEKWEQMSAAVAGSVNIPPDSGPIAPSTAGTYALPIRSLLPNERLMGHEGGVIDVINTDIFDPDPIATIKAMVKRILIKTGA